METVSASRFNPASISRVLWALVLLTLPVTSFRFMPFMGSGTYVRPLALYPLVLLLPVLLMRLKRGEIARPWPGTLIILLAFLLAALGATAFGAALTPIDLRGAGFFDRALRAVVTLVVGLSFFVAAVWMNQDEADLKFSVKWLMVGLLVDLLWGSVQFIGLNSSHRQQLIKIQNLFSVRGLVKNKRISGFSYEPSWLAGQIADLYLPWLVASVLLRYRAFKAGGHPPSGLLGRVYNLFGRFGPLVVSLIEPALFLAASAGLLMTYSRSGLLIALLAGLATFVLAGRHALADFWGWVRAGFDRQRWTSLVSTLKLAGLRIFLAVLVLAVLAGSVVFLADKGYIAAIFKPGKTDIFSFAQDAYLGPRLAYAQAALTGFDAHPLTGIGLGASGFAMYQNMPDWALYGEPEIAKQMSPDASDLYPNSKILYVRLLAETGLLGFVLFLAFYMALFADALSLLRPVSGTEPASPAARWLAAAGIFALTAVVLQGVSQDSFAMPEMWVTIGMLAGAAGAFSTRSHPEL
jgi:O-antigen ligase